MRQVRGQVVDASLHRACFRSWCVSYGFCAYCYICIDHHPAVWPSSNMTSNHLLPDSMVRPVKLSKLCKQHATLLIGGALRVPMPQSALCAAC